MGCMLFLLGVSAALLSLRVKSGRESWDEEFHAETEMAAKTKGGNEVRISWAGMKGAGYIAIVAGPHGCIQARLLAEPER